MTVISAAVTKQDGVVIAADSELSWEVAKGDEGPAKLWIDRERKYIFGGAGSLRALQVIKHWMEWPEFREHHIDVEAFVVKEVVPVLKAVLDEHHAYDKKNNTFEAEFIMAWQNNLVVIDSDFGITIPVTGRWAIGSGQNEAFGSMGDMGPWTKNDVIKSARVATKTAIGVGGDVYYVTSKSLEIKKS